MRGALDVVSKSRTDGGVIDDRIRSGEEGRGNSFSEAFRWTVETAVGLEELPGGYVVNHASA